MPLVNFDQALAMAEEVTSGLDILEFRRAVDQESSVSVSPPGKRKRDCPLRFGNVQMARSGIQSMCQILSVPYSFIRDKDPAFQAYVLNYCADRLKFIETSNAIVRNETICQWIRKDSIVVSDAVILRVIAAVVDAVEELAVIDISRAVFSVDQSNYSVYFTDLGSLKVKDGLLYPGFRFGNSILGQNQLQIEAYVFYTACANGLIKAMPGYDAKVLIRDMEYPLRVQEFIENSIPRAVQAVEDFRSLCDIPIEDPHKSIYSLSKTLKLGPARRESLLLMMDPENPPRTMFDLVNLITSFANYQNTRTSVALQQIAGKSIDLILASSSCPTCKGLVPAGMLKSHVHDEDDEDGEDDDGLDDLVD